MKQYTTPEQTDKLIELGFKHYKCEIEEKSEWSYEWRKETFTIAHLIEMLPKTINAFYDLSIMSSYKGWWVLYGIIGDGDMWSIEHEVYRNELIDALYDMIVKLKEEGEI